MSCMCAYLFICMQNVTTIWETSSLQFIYQLLLDLKTFFVFFLSRIHLHTHPYTQTRRHARLKLHTYTATYAHTSMSHTFQSLIREAKFGDSFLLPTGETVGRIVASECRVRVWSVACPYTTATISQPIFFLLLTKKKKNGTKIQHPQSPPQEPTSGRGRSAETSVVLRNRDGMGGAFVSTNSTHKHTHKQ